MGLRLEHFPLFAIDTVALPSELIPLQIFEDRYKLMIEHCLENGSEFGIVWKSDDGVRPIGCACEITDIIERLPDGRFHLLVRGTRAFRVTDQRDNTPFPAGTVEFLEDHLEITDQKALSEAQSAYAQLVEDVTHRKPHKELTEASAYEMAATLELGLDAKQGLLDLRSESARLRLLTRLFRAADRRYRFLDRIEKRAQSNGKVHLPPE